MVTEVLQKLLVVLGPQGLVYGGIGLLFLVFSSSGAYLWRKKRKASQALDRLAAKSKAAGLLAFGDEHESEESIALTSKPIYDRGHTSATRAASTRETEIMATSTASTEQYKQFFREITDALRDQNIKLLKKSMSDALYNEALQLCQIPGATAKQFSDVNCSVQTADGESVSVHFRARALNAGYVEQVWYMTKSPSRNTIKLERII